MATVTKVWQFTSDIEDMIVSGGSGSISFTWVAGEGTPVGSMMTVFFGAVQHDETTVKSGVGLRWSDWGVPSGMHVTRVTVDYDFKTGSPIIAGQQSTTTFDVLDNTGTTVLSAPLKVHTGVGNTAWAHISGPEQSVIEGKQDDTQPVRFAMTTHIDSAVMFNHNEYFDNIRLTMTYEEDNPPGGDDGGGGGDDIVDPPGGDQNGPCEPLYLLAGSTVNDILHHASAWVHEQRYYITVGKRTLCFDPVVGAWTDCGYGDVQSCVAVSIDRYPPMMFMSVNQFNPVEDVVSKQMFANPNIVFATRLNRPWHQATFDVPWQPRVMLGPFDGEGSDKARIKRAVRLRVWGSHFDMRDQNGIDAFGTLIMHSDNGITETYPIIAQMLTDYEFPRVNFAHYNPPRVNEAGIMLVQEFTPMMRGRVLWCELIFWRQCVTVNQSMLEYVVTL